MSHHSTGSMADAAYAELRDTVTHRHAGVAAATAGSAAATSSSGALVSPSSAGSSAAAPVPSGDLTLWQRYLRQLALRPVRTKALTSALCSAVASVLAQKSLGVPLASINLTGVRNQALLGFLRGITIHYWQDALSALFRRLGYPTPASQSTTPVVLGKLVLDQSIFASFNLAWFLYALGWLEGRPIAESHLKFRNEFFSMLKMNWRVWPLVNFVNFTYVPPQLRALVLNLVGVGWMVYLVRAMAAAKLAAMAATKAVVAK